MAIAPRGQQSQHKWAYHVENRSVERVEEREQGVRQREDDEGNDNQQRAQQAGDAAIDQPPQARPSVLVEVGAQIVQPLIEKIPDPDTAVDKIRHGIEHADDRAKHRPVVDEHQAEDEVGDSSDREHPHIPAHGKGLVGAVQEAEQQDGAGHSQHRGRDVVTVNPGERRQEKLFEIKHGSMPLQKIDQLLAQVRSVRGSGFHVGAGVGKVDGSHAHQVGRRGLRIGIGADEPRVGLGLDNGGATGRRALDALVNLVGRLNLQIRQLVDGDGPFHRRLRHRVGHVDPVADILRCSGLARYRTVHRRIIRARLADQVGISRQEGLFELLRPRQRRAAHRNPQEILNLRVGSSQDADEG